MLAPGKIYIGRPVRLKASFAQDDVATDPDTVSLVTHSPCGVETTYTYDDDEITKSSAGHYYIDVTPDEAGRWFFRWVTTGDDTTDAQEGNFLVQDSVFYCQAFNGDYI